MPKSNKSEVKAGKCVSYYSLFSGVGYNDAHVLEFFELMQRITNFSFIYF